MLLRRLTQAGELLQPQRGWYTLLEMGVIHSIYVFAPR